MAFYMSVSVSDELQLFAQEIVGHSNVVTRHIVLDVVTFNRREFVYILVKHIECET